ncbi:FAD-dependent oxidoreductase [Novosphingobium sp. PY1]|uniref:FAD-dependent oxidoreductase n=1 Tax=Novosphingobium sp. PY1 TaxID=1882221 RepID=UPI001AA5C094|nr:FAD-dependent oxidoreductase [Novosphingobium sp. PY1]GFM27454.1 fumarate reductase flavoprotein subunit [Novosphingobium sp. PY1]
MSETMHVPVVVIGAGATGLCAALAATDAGVEVLVIERDDTPLGSTAMSTGLIPAAGTPEQAEQGIVDSPEIFAQDIARKTKGTADPDMALNLSRESAETVGWLRKKHGIPLDLLDGFTYPGHSARRMYGTPKRSGGELMGCLQGAAEDAGVMLLTSATVTELVAENGRVTLVRFQRPDGALEEVSCDALILACSGFAGNAELVARHIPEMAEATFHGHPGNKGDALRWGEQLGAAMADLTAYQGHGGLAAGHGIPILWPLIMQGGFQVNLQGERFSNEAAGYSEQAAKVNAQPGHVAWSIFDARLHELMCDFEDYRDALSANAVVKAGTLEELAKATKLPADVLARTTEDVAAMTRGEAPDPFGRDFTGKPQLAAPWYAAKVTGALFHTQGGLVVDDHARVLRADGSPLPNLYAGGGAARGISGDGADGYLAGNGLLTATTLGKLAGRAAAAQVEVK